MALDLTPQRDRDPRPGHQGPMTSHSEASLLSVSWPYIALARLLKAPSHAEITADKPSDSQSCSNRPGDCCIRLLCMGLLGVSLLGGCASGQPGDTTLTPTAPSQPPVTQVSAPQASAPQASAPQASAPQAADEPLRLPTSFLDTLLVGIGQDQGISTDQIQLLDATEQTWPDGCLGLAKPDEICTQALVEGWRVIATDGESIWHYRTNSAGDQIRFVPEQSR